MARTTKDKEESTEGALNELKRDLEREINEIRTTIKEKGPEAAEESMKNLKAEFDGRLEEIRDRLDESVETSRSVIREHPLIAVGGALAVGLLVGLLFAGGKSKN